MEKPMKKYIKKLILSLLALSIAMVAILLISRLYYRNQSSVEGTEVSSETESAPDTETLQGSEALSSTETLPDTETLSDTEVASDTELPLDTENTSRQSYLEKCALDYVDAPIMRTREEAVLKIKELSRWFPALYQVYLNEDKYFLEILLSVANNPEMTDYAYGYLTTDGSVTGGITEDETPESYPLFLQWDIRWGYMPYGSQGTLGSSGCGPACLAMAVYALTGNTECTPDAVARYSLEKNYYIEGVGTAWALLDNYPKKYGLKVEHPSTSEKNLKKYLDRGNILICSVRPGDFTAEGHFIVIYGYDETGFKINDPKCVYRSRLTWTYDQIQDDIKRIWAIGK